MDIISALKYLIIPSYNNTRNSIFTDSDDTYLSGRMQLHIYSGTESIVDIHGHQTHYLTCIRQLFDLSVPVLDSVISS